MAKETWLQKERRIADSLFGSGVLVYGWRKKARFQHHHRLIDPTFKDTTCRLQGGHAIQSVNATGKCQISKCYVTVSISACMLPERELSI